jgi:hypothetical protein
MRPQRNRLRPLRWRLWRGRLPTCILRRNCPEHPKLRTCIPRRNCPEHPKLRSLRDNRTVEGASPATL